MSFSLWRDCPRRTARSPRCALILAGLWVLSCLGLASCERPSTRASSAPPIDSTLASGSCDDTRASFDPGPVTAVLADQRKAWNRGDIEGFLAGYERSPELLFTSGAAVRRGFDETRAKFRARYGDDPETMGQLGFEILDVRPLGACAQAAVVLGRWRLEDTPEAGAGVFSVILEHQIQGWKIVHDHTSAATD